MVEKKIIRALVPYSKTFYFLDQAKPMGVAYEMLKLFENQLNKKLKIKHLKVHVVVIPTPRDRLIPVLAEGLGDIAVGNLTITQDRLKSVDFSNPMLTGVNEILEDEDLLEMVNAGLIPMIVIKSHNGEFWARIFDGITLHPEIKLRENAEIAWAMPKNTPLLTKEINEFIKKNKEGKKQPKWGLIPMSGSGMWKWWQPNGSAGRRFNM